MGPSGIIVGSLLGGTAAGGIVLLYLRSLRINKKKSGVENLLKLREECWLLYEELQEIKTYKDKCKNIITGDVGILTANNQLKKILESDKDEAYKEQRIQGQIMDFLTNMAVSNAMEEINENKETKIVMPPMKRKLMDKNAFLDNLKTDSSFQEKKYKAVITKEQQEIQDEKSDLRSVRTLEQLIPLLNEFLVIRNNEHSISDNNIIIMANKYLTDSNRILKKKGYVN